MTIWVETESGFVIADKARLLGDSGEELAWAEEYVRPSPYLGWVLGKYVEADKANSNRQFFTLDGIRMAQPSLVHAPMNINHDMHAVVGAYVSSEIVWPTDAASDLPLNPYMEALGVVWKKKFPEAYSLVKAAESAGALYFSMETIPRQIQCTGNDVACNEIFDYQGPMSASYCAHLNDPHEYGTQKTLIDPVFVGGALIIPPAKPGWKNATASQIAALVSDQLNPGAVDATIAALEEESPHLGPAQWEFVMAMLLDTTRKI